MAAARYWRLIGLETYSGGDLELSELHLYGASGRVDATATLTSTIAPTAGTLAALQDDNLGTTCSFAGVAVRASGFALVWDFGAGNTADAIGVRLGASANQSAFLACCTLQYSIDGAQWQRLAEFARYAWPGAGAYVVAPTAGDSAFDKVALLLHCDGADGSTTFTDSSANPMEVTAYSGAAISAAQSKFGGASAVFDGINDYLSAPAHADFDFGTGDFTLEAWVFPATISGYACIICRQRSIGGEGLFQLRLNSGKPELVFCANSSSSVVTLAAAQSIAANTWTHIAFARQGGTGRLFVDGVLADTKSTAGTLNVAGRPLTIGVLNDGNGTNLVAFFSGHIDDVRITKGLARYIANFTPPTGPFPGGVRGTVFVAPTLHTADSAVQIAASTPVPAHSTNSAPRLQLARDVEYGGPGTIYGTTKTQGTPNTPTKARVVLLHQRSKQPVRETWSDPVTGAFAFTGIDTTQQFLTLAEDAAGNFRPVAANRLTPEVLP